MKMQDYGRIKTLNGCHSRFFVFPFTKYTLYCIVDYTTNQPIITGGVSFVKTVLDESRPIFQQIYEMIEDDIIEGELEEGDQIPSTTELSKFYQINRATAQKGLAMLIEDGNAYKQRGVGIFVTEGATKRLIEKRKKEFQLQFIKPMLEESKRLRMSKEEVIKFIEEDNDD